MKELYIDSRTAADGTGQSLCFDYYVLIGEVDTGPFFCESYGVAVAQRGTQYVSRVPNVTTSADRIDQLLSLLLDYVATPVNLPEVLQDWL